LHEQAVTYLRQAGLKAAARSALHDARTYFDQALSIVETLPATESTLQMGFDIRLELRQTLNQLGEIARMLERVLEANALAERLNDDRRRGRACAFMTAIHVHLGEPDEAITSGTRALAIAGRLGDLRLRILTTSFLVQAHYHRGELERAVQLATDNLGELPADWVYESFGGAQPASVMYRVWLMASLGELGRFAEAVEPEAEAIRIAARTQHAFTVGFVHNAAGGIHLLRGDWAQARSLIEHATAVNRAGNVGLLLSQSVVNSAWVLAQLGEASEGLSRLREGEQLLERLAARGASAFSDRTIGGWVEPRWCSAVSTTRSAWATARWSPLRVSPCTRPTRSTCSVTSRPTPTGSMPSAARPTTARRWPSPSRAACARSSPTATSASGSCARARASATRRASTSPPRPRCTARWTCGSSWSNRRRS